MKEEEEDNDSIDSTRMSEEEDMNSGLLTEESADLAIEKSFHNSDWDSRLELLRVCSSNGKFVTKKARAQPIGGKWGSDEDEHLRGIVRLHGAENWRKVAALLGPTRTDVQCLHRWNKVLRPGLQKGAWSIDEDKLVREAVQYQATNGVGRILWSEIAAQLPGRLGKQCRERYFNHLDPSINKGDWTPPEDRILFEGQKQFGNRWCEISKVLPGRTENSVKNRWNSSAMRRWLKENNLNPGSGAPLHDIAAIEDLQRALSSFSEALAVCGIIISKETAATLLSDMSSAAADEDKAKSKLKDKVKKNKSKRKIKIFENEDAFEDSFVEGRMLNLDSNISKPTSKSIALNNLASSCNSYRKDDTENDHIVSEIERRSDPSHELNHGASNGITDNNSRRNKNDSAIRNNLSIANGMTIPSHLRPPVIVTVSGKRSQRLPSDTWRANSAESIAATGSSEDHELLELLSNMKSSPKWQHARQIQVDDFTFEKSNSSGTGNLNVNGNGNNGFRNINDENEKAPPFVERSTSKPKDHQSQPHPFSINRAEVGGGGGGSESARGGGGKRVKVEVKSNIDSKTAKKPADATTPTDLALRLVRLELARREDEASNRQQKGRGYFPQDQNTIDFNPNDFKDRDVECERGNITVPFDLLSFFKYLDTFTQRCLMRQLVDHFQQTSYTPRNYNALLPTPRTPFDKSQGRYNPGICGEVSYTYGYNDTTHTLILNSPRGGEVSSQSYSFNPNCFESDFRASNTPKEKSCSNGNNIGSNGGGGGGESDSRKRREESMPYQQYFDAPINAAVDVAMKCATRESSFEEIISWLGETHDPSANYDSRSRMSATMTTEVGPPDRSGLMPPPVPRKTSPGGGMLLPSHLRPPLIVTGVPTSTRIGVDAATGKQCSKVDQSVLSNGHVSSSNGHGSNMPLSRIEKNDSSDDHKLVVELLSNLKTSPKWGRDIEFQVQPLGSIVTPYADPMISKLSATSTATKNYTSTNTNSNTNLNVKKGKRKSEGDMSQYAPHSLSESSNGTVDQALQRVRAELASLEKNKKDNDSDSGSDLGADSSTVPFQLLPYFKYLDDLAQRCLMRQLVDHFQQTSYTPRNYNALLPTPRLLISPSPRYSGSYSYSNNTNNMVDFIDPNCFEEGAVTCTSHSAGRSLDENIMSNTGSKKRATHVKERGGHSISSLRSSDDDTFDIDSASNSSSSADDVQAYLDAPINAAVNVALKCATREASFEEVLSWLIGASSHQFGLEYSPPPDREMCAPHCNQTVMTSSVYNLS